LVPITRARKVASKREPIYNDHVHFEIIGEIEDIEIIAVGGRIRDIMRLRRSFGPGRWRKLKGIARVRLANGIIRRAEVHWYEAHGIGRKKMKIKRLLD
jgi:hypothetical protein